MIGKAQCTCGHVPRKDIFVICWCERSCLVNFGPPKERPHTLAYLRLCRRLRAAAFFSQNKVKELLQRIDQQYSLAQCEKVTKKYTALINGKSSKHVRMLLAHRHGPYARMLFWHKKLGGYGKSRLSEIRDIFKAGFFPSQTVGRRRRASKAAAESLKGLCKGKVGSGHWASEMQMLSFLEHK